MKPFSLLTRNHSHICFFDIDLINLLYKNNMSMDDFYLAVELCIGNKGQWVLDINDKCEIFISAAINITIPHPVTYKVREKDVNTKIED